MVWIIVTVVLVAIVLSLSLAGYVMSQVDMLLGMGLGMSTGPIMMMVYKKWNTRRKVNKILDDIVQMRKEETGREEKAQEKVEEKALEQQEPISL